MSVNQSVNSYYGWLIPASDDVLNWAKELDYDLPKGVELLNMDSTDVVFGVSLFNSGSNRWGPMEGDNLSISQVDMYQKFTDWMFKEGGEALVSRFSEAEWGQHKLHIYINTF